MSYSKDLYSEMSRRDYELPVYGESSEPWRQFEDLYDVGVWPSSDELDRDTNEEC